MIAPGSEANRRQRRPPEPRAERPREIFAPRANVVQPYPRERTGHQRRMAHLSIVLLRNAEVPRLAGAGAPQRGGPPRQGGGGPRPPYRGGPPAGRQPESGSPTPPPPPPPKKPAKPKPLPKLSSGALKGASPLHTFGELEHLQGP